MIDYNKVIENDFELPLYLKVHKEIKAYLDINGPATFTEIIKNVRGSDRRTLRLLDQMVKRGELAFKDGRFMVDSATKRFTRQDMVCPRCDGKIVIYDDLKDLQALMEEAYRLKPRPTFVFDQRPVNLQTTMRRIAYLLFRDDLKGKRIAVLGDDDLTGLAIGLLDLAKDVVIFEIDERLVGFIDGFARKHSRPIKVESQNLIKDIPSKYEGHFDVFLSDPTPKKVPFTVFTNVGVKLLSKPGIGYLSMYPSCMDLSLDLQDSLHKMRLLITDLIPYFTEYEFIKETFSDTDLILLSDYSEGNNTISFHETLVRVMTTDETVPIEMEYDPREIQGSATKRVLKNPQKDPTLMGNNEEHKRYLQKIMDDFNDGQ